jgi:hypothetical protein
VRITEVPLLDISPVNAAGITICEDFSSDVLVLFNVQSESMSPLDLPPHIKASDGHICTQDTTDSGKSDVTPLFDVSKWWQVNLLQHQHANSAMP